MPRAARSSDGRYGQFVVTPEIVGRLDEVTQERLRQAVADPSRSPGDVRSMQNRAIAARKQERAAERARQRAAVELLVSDVAAAMRCP